MSHRETPIFIPCAGEQLLGILSLPEQAANTAVLIIVGGPQYRAGSHRQFVLLARALVDAGYPALRFDYRGMGDSTGDPRSFEQIDEDIAAAIDALFQHAPQIERVVLWGLCDAASAAIIHWYSKRDARIAGMVLLNPWIRTEATLARTQIRHYYGRRLFEREFWQKLLAGGIDIRKVISELISTRRLAKSAGSQTLDTASLPFHQKMRLGLAQFPGKILLLLSGNDYTAKEFIDCVSTDPAWMRVMQRSEVSRHDFPEANHTFSTKSLRNEVELRTVSWLNSIDYPASP